MSFWKPNSISGFEEGVRFASVVPAMFGVMGSTVLGADVYVNERNLEWENIFELHTDESTLLMYVLAIVPHIILLARARNAGYLALSPLKAQKELRERIKKGEARDPRY